MHTHPSQLHLIAYPLLLLGLMACTFLQVEKGVSLKELIDTEHPKSMNLTLSDSSEVTLHQPRMAGGDSLVGVVDGKPFGVAVVDVTEVAIPRFSMGMTLALTAAAATLGWVVYSGWPCTSRHPCPESLSL